MEQEHSKHGDLLLFPNLKDSYPSLALKLLHSLVELNTGINFDFLLKVDLDSFVRVRKVLEELRVCSLLHVSGNYCTTFGFTGSIARPDRPILGLFHRPLPGGEDPRPQVLRALVQPLRQLPSVRARRRVRPRKGTSQIHRRQCRAVTGEILH